MSFSVYTDGKYASIGCNGSQDCMMAMFFAAYAAGDRPEADRAANWVAPLPVREKPDDYPEFDYRIPGWRKAHRAQVTKLLTYRPEEVLWLGLARTTRLDYRTARTIDRGLLLKPVRDPVLKGLVRLYEAAVGRYDDPRPRATTIPADEVELVADAVQEVLPALADSGFHRRAQEVLAVLLYALAHEQEVRCG